MVVVVVMVVHVADFGECEGGGVTERREGGREGEEGRHGCSTVWAESASSPFGPGDKVGRPTSELLVAVTVELCPLFCDSGSELESSS